MNYIDIYKSSALFKIIENDIKEGMLKHAYLLCGFDENLMEHYSLMLAKQILCESKQKPCNECRTCLKIEHGNHMDVLKFPSNNSNSILTDDMNKIVEETYNAPMEGNAKVFILNSFEKTTIIAQNKFLKTLEEPTKNCYFILTVANKNSVLNTILSRCYLINIPPLSNEELKSIILANQRVDKNNIDVYIASANGNSTKAWKLLEDKEFLNIKQLVFNLFYSMKNSSEVIDYSSKLMSYKGRLKEVLDEMFLFVRDLAVVKTNENLVINKNKLTDIKVLSNFYSASACKLIVKLIEEAGKQIDANCSPTAIVDGLLMNILEVKYKCQK